MSKTIQKRIKNVKSVWKAHKSINLCQRHSDRDCSDYDLCFTEMHWLEPKPDVVDGRSSPQCPLIFWCESFERSLITGALPHDLFAYGLGQKYNHTERGHWQHSFRFDFGISKARGARWFTPCAVASMHLSDADWFHWAVVLAAACIVIPQESKTMSDSRIIKVEWDRERRCWVAPHYTWILRVRSKVDENWLSEIANFQMQTD